MSALRRSNFANVLGAALVLGLNASAVYADPPRPDALKMRLVVRPSDKVASTAGAPIAEVVLPSSELEPAPAAAISASEAARQTAEVLELCAELATIDGELERCVARKLGATVKR